MPLHHHHVRLVARCMVLHASCLSLSFHRLRCEVQRPWDGPFFSNLASKVSDARER